MNNLNIGTNGKYEYKDIFIKVQEYISNNFQDLFSDENIDNKDDKKEKLQRYISQYLTAKKIQCVEYPEEQKLIDRLYRDMAEFSFITDWLECAEKIGLEEIDINSWDDIEVIINGRKGKIPEKFLSPQHAVNIIRRMLQRSGGIIDDGSPYALGSIGKNVRITAIKTPLLDDDVGICASIRIVSAVRISKSKLSNGTATEDMLTFLAGILRYGVSICVAGNTGSGKTSTAGWLLSTIPNDKRIYTIEQGSRELNLVKRNSDNNDIVNSVIHTITRKSDDEKYTVSQEKLLDLALRFNPDIICVGEMRSSEAFAAQEAARTGHTVITTIHSKTAVSTYMRMTTLAKRAYEFDDATLMSLMVEAFPIIVYQRQLEDYSRKIMEIIEGEKYENGKVIYRTLFRYLVDDNYIENGQKVVKGHFEQCEKISENLRKELLQNGASKKFTDKF